MAALGLLLLHAGFSLAVASRGYSSLRCMASHCGGFSCCGARALGTQASVVVARGLQSAGSVVVAHGPSRSTACGILTDQGSNPCPLHWQADSQPLHHQGSPLKGFLIVLLGLLPTFLIIASMGEHLLCVGSAHFILGFPLQCP